MEVNNKGITLVALVVTIIALLILAGISIAITLGDEGVIGKAKSAKLEQRYGSIMDEVKIRESDLEIAFEKGEDGENRGDFIERIFNLGLLNENEDYVADDLSELYLGRIEGDIYKYTIEIKDGSFKAMKAEERIIELPDANAPGNEHLKNLTLLVRTTQTNEKIYIPVSGMINLKVNWDSANYPNNFITPMFENDSRMYLVNSNVPTYTYAQPGTYEVQIKGESGPNSYLGGANVPDFFYENENLVGIKCWGDHNFANIGSLGGNIEGAIPSPSRNSFKKTSGFNMVFRESPITSIHEDLFIGLPYLTTLRQTFYDCSNLQSIPENLFSNNPYMRSFEATFAYCTTLTSIPEKLFFNSPEIKIFHNSFGYCTSLTFIPEKLFFNSPDVTTFHLTFSECTNLTTIPPNLFSKNLNVSDFSYTFYSCTSLSGLAPELWKRTNVTNNSYCFKYCTLLSNYNDIPYGWK